MSGGRLHVYSESLKQRTKEFAHRCVRLCLALPNSPLGNHIRGQLIRCGTSVASNYRATCVAQSRAHFVSRLSVVIEEADESAFWMEFIVEESMVNAARVAPLLDEAHELAAMFVAARKTAKDRSPEFEASTASEHNNQ